MLHVILRNVLEERAELLFRPRSETVRQQRREKAASGSGQESEGISNPSSAFLKQKQPCED